MLLLETNGGINEQYL